MIDLITGLPGNSKTLYTIAYVKDWAERENRPVYYSGIPELTLPWTEIDPDKWMDCPPGAIIVIDECQRVFRNRSINSQPPKFVTDLETHRHLGVDLVFITQHPMLIDPAVRRLTGRHRHMVRIWGMEASTVHEWPAVRENCDKPAARKDSEKAKWKFDKSVYGLYKSAEVHTVKRSIPMRAKLLLLLPVVLGAAGWYMYDFAQKKATPVPNKQVSASPPGVRPAAGDRAPAGRTAVLDPLAELKQYVYAATPRAQGLPHTAPKYDELTKPTAVPVPVACIATASRCLCYTQQGTRMDVRDQQCRDIAEFGYFQDFDPNGNKQAEERQRVANSAAVLNREGNPLPLSGASTVDRSEVVSSAKEDGFGVLGRRGPGVRVPGAGNDFGAAKPV